MAWYRVTISSNGGGDSDWVFRQDREVPTDPKKLKEFEREVYQEWIDSDQDWANDSEQGYSGTSTREDPPISFLDTEVAQARRAIAGAITHFNRVVKERRARMRDRKAIQNAIMEFHCRDFKCHTKTVGIVTFDPKSYGHHAMDIPCSKCGGPAYASGAMWREDDPKAPKLT